MKAYATISFSFCFKSLLFLLQYTNLSGIGRSDILLLFTYNVLKEVHSNKLLQLKLNE